ncbi:HD-GYP domain-containing protein, partial [Gemmiger sp.]
LYYLLTLLLAVHTIRHKKSVNRQGMILMMLSFLLAIAGYVVERALHWKAEIMPLLYVVLIAVSLLQTYQANLFTIEENKSIIHEQMEKVGFIAFGLRGQYMGCNTCAEQLFPEMQAYTVGQVPYAASESFQKNVMNVVAQFAKTHSVQSRCHEHEKVQTLALNGRQYDCMIHTLQNYYKKVVGYVVEIRDETEHYRALELFENYNRQLTADVTAKTAQITSMQEKIILGLAQIIESRDLSTGGHIKRTSTVVRIFADELLKSNMGFSEEFLHRVVRSAPMHDLGKIGVDDAILRKQGRFTEEEYAKMKEHAAIGAHIVREVLTDVEAPDFVEVAVNVAHYHHEKVDGTGYPCGLKGETIPIEARIMALADVFDALVSKRCYKEAFTFDKAFSIIEQDAGTHFDAALAEVFLRCRPQLEAFYKGEAAA